MYSVQLYYADVHTCHVIIGYYCVPNLVPSSKIRNADTQRLSIFDISNKR